MQDNTKLPASIRQRLEMVQQDRDRADLQRYLDSTEPQQQVNPIHEMGRTLASSDPRACALLIAGSMGYEGFEFFKERITIEETVSPYKVYGINLGFDVVTKTTTERTREGARLVPRR